MDERYFIDSEFLSEQALEKKHRLENDPGSRTDHMKYMEGMEQIESDIMEKVLSQMNSYDYSKYTPKDVAAALEHDSCSVEDLKALLSPAAEPFLERMAQKWFGYTPAGCESEPEGSMKDEIDEASTVTNVCFDIRTDLNTPSVYSVDAYEALLMLQCQLIEPNGRKSPMMEEFSSEQFDCDEDRIRYLKEDVVPRAYKMAAILTQNYRKYIEMAELDSEAVIKDLAGRYIDAWLNNTDLNLDGEFDYYKNAGLIQSEFDDI